jgi:hypothetical protein
MPRHRWRLQTQSNCSASHVPGSRPTQIVKDEALDLFGKNSWKEPCPFLRRTPHIRVRPANSGPEKGETTMKNTMLVALAAGILSVPGAMEAQQIRIQPQPRQFQPRQTNNATPANRLRHAATYNSRPEGVHINPDYFASHYGNAHPFHFSDDPFRQIGGELYFNFNGGWFGVIGTVPGNWGLQADSFYVGLGEDGNYYLYNARFPDMALQLTFVENPGDDQVSDDGDPGDE